jgi:hypothetical protein
MVYLDPRDDDVGVKMLIAVLLVVAVGFVVAVL